jgi:hypothetical protein
MTALTSRTTGATDLMEPIIAYSAYWHADSNKGRIYIKLQSEETVFIDLDSPAELNALCDLLRHNPQMVYDTDKKMLATGWLRPGAR